MGAQFMHTSGTRIRIGNAITVTRGNVASRDPCLLRNPWHKFGGYLKRKPVLGLILSFLFRALALYTHIYGSKHSIYRARATPFAPHPVQFHREHKDIPQNCYCW